MLRLKRIEAAGFGPFADRQTIEFPQQKGVVVVYGENMRGKTSLLNAIRYAFFGTVLGRGARVRRLHSVCNRELASQGTYGFSVSLSFSYAGADYELVRECTPSVSIPTTDEDYRQTVMLRRGTTVLGPQEREAVLQQVIPKEVSRFFLFDGELLQEYEELLVNDSQTGHRISEAIERILGVPVLKKARAHLTQMSDEADQLAAKEASRHQETEGLGHALETATKQKEAHQGELRRVEGQLKEYLTERAEAEQYLQSVQKYASILQDRDEASAKLDGETKREVALRSEIQKAMAEAWRSLLREPVRSAREAAREEAQKASSALIIALRGKAVDAGRCEICDQPVAGDTLAKLRATLPEIEQADRSEADPIAAVSDALVKIADLNRFRDADNTAQVGLLWKQLRACVIEQATLKGTISDLNSALSDSDPQAVRAGRAKYGEIVEKITIVKRAVEEEMTKIRGLDENIQRLKKKLSASGTTHLAESQRRAELLRHASEVFGAAVERYKSRLRTRVEGTASKLFLSMTTEKEDYAGLAINENYGLTIRHRDGKAEEARSAGAEHVVALALMGALQNNAPLRGPIVMDSPFGRLDERHTDNVLLTLPDMAEQVVLLVYEAEVGRDRVRHLLGSRLLKEYELQRLSARRTTVVEVR